MTQVTATEFKMNLGHYLEKAHTEDIWITKNGKINLSIRMFPQLIPSPGF